MGIVMSRHDVLILFDVTNGNPNGDPDAGNLPRTDPTSNRGLVSDVCLKRKIRNFVVSFCVDEHGRPEQGRDILIRQGNILNNEIKTEIDKAASELDKEASNGKKAEKAREFLCRRFYDVRTFGGVLSTGADVMKGSAYGQVRGPVQFTFGRSYHPITPVEISITRCAVTKPEDEMKERTMGNKHIVPYALYAAKAYVSPMFARTTGFSDEDLKLFFQALDQMFTHDQSAARAEMTVRGIYDFEHVGTQAEANAEQNRKEAMLGCAHAHKLFEEVKVELKPGKQWPQSFDDYTVTDAWQGKKCGDIVVPGVKLYRRVDPRAVA